MTRFVVSLCTAALAVAAAAAEPIPGVGPVGEVKKVHGGFRFTEGPAWDGRGALYFTDIPADRIHKTDGSDVEVFVEPAGHCNGLMAGPGGVLFACAMDGALVKFDLKSGEKTVLADEHEGVRFNAPNDLVIDRAGGIYFTDPRFSAPEPWPQKVEAVYYRGADGTVTRLIDDLTGKAPNGVILSPDEKTLYVVCSMQDEVMSYPVESPGRLGEGKVFARLEQAEGKTEGGGDGLTVDVNGNLYITTGLGVEVFSPKGESLGVIALPEQPANVTFGGPDLKTLYATARTGLYAVPMEAMGHAFPGKAE